MLVPGERAGSSIQVPGFETLRDAEERVDSSIQAPGFLHEWRVPIPPDSSTPRFEPQVLVPGERAGSSIQLPGFEALRGAEQRVDSSIQTLGLALHCLAAILHQQHTRSLLQALGF